MLKNNIYRIFSVLANARLKDIEKNISKINAFISINKEISLPFDNDYFGAINRNVKNIKKAKNVYLVDQQRLNHALFWFVKVNEIDGIAIEYIKKGNIDKAIDIWSKQVSKAEINNKNYSFYSNISSLLFYKGEYVKAIEYKFQLIESSFFKDFADLVLGVNHSDFQNDALDNFIKNSIFHIQSLDLKDSEIIEIFSKSNTRIKDCVTEYFTKKPILNINRAIKIAKQSIEDIANNNSKKYQVSKINLIRLLGSKVIDDVVIVKKEYTIDTIDEDTGKVVSIDKNKILIESKSKLDIQHINILIKSGIKQINILKKIPSKNSAGTIGRNLMNTAKKDIDILKSVFGNKDLHYSSLSDKLASQLEQCGITYYNNSANDLDYFDVYEYALSIACGDIIKKKLNEAIEHSKNEKLNEGVDDLISFINKFQKNKNSNLNDATYLLDDCEPILKKIKINRGKDDELFLNLNGAIVRNIMGVIIDIENKRIDTSDKYSIRL